jgi:hypothetical protein
MCFQEELLSGQLCEFTPKGHTAFSGRVAEGGAALALEIPSKTVYNIPKTVWRKKRTRLTAVPLTVTLS